ncbi:MAG TPA: serine/threonine-protein kinase [Pyrinomonadaceae bacterium]|nr:serine/threonine-protein kinase [Pyrinomonadaceae bacterium]
MTPERWQEVEAVLQAALDLPATERGALLAETCSEDPDLQREAISLLQAHDAAGDFLEQSALEQDAQVLLGDDRIAAIAREIGPYKIIEQLGRGGMGEVYLARDQRLDRPVALKILPAYFVFDAERLRRFQIEARAASGLNHSNILTIYEVGESDGVHFIATEFIDGKTIRELIRAERLTLGELIEIAIQLVSGLSAAHAAGIVHRDIKPENVMRRHDGVVRILDFGIAKLVEAPTSEMATEVGALLGTPAYVSPEQVRGQVVDERTDIWSCGVVLYEMLTGQRPFAGDTNADTIVTILERPPAQIFPGDGRSRALRLIQSITGKALRKDRSERYQTAAEMLDDLRSVKRQLEFDKKLVGAQTRVAEIPALVSAQISRSQQRRLTIASIAALAVMLLFAGFLFRRSILSRTDAPAPATRIYTQMSEAEQLGFVSEQEQRIAAMMGERPVKLNDEALRAIKTRVDRYVAPPRPGGDSLPVIYGRAAPYVPVISKAFSARRIPLVIGIYLPMIESAYKPCYENSIGAKGLFQFLPETAQQYGVARKDMCDVNKMAPAAAHYIADRMAELGDDSQSMTLVLLSYNRGADSVLDALRMLRETDVNYERNFWTLFANRDKLDETFRQESAYYVPAFFAAAIIGENPQAFGLNIPPLSSQSNGAVARP